MPCARPQIDWRLVLMGAVLVGIALIFNVLSGGIFLSPENLYNIAQQTAVVGIVATVVVLIIVARHIDLSVGSVMGFVGVLVAYLMYTARLVAGRPPRWPGWRWPSPVSLYQGALTAVLGVPSFVVTLGGLMSLSRRGLSGGRRQDAAGQRRVLPAPGRRLRRRASA